ncbi:MAG: PKD domain-containing protein [Salinivirgaceae bacterium]
MKTINPSFLLLCCLLLAISFETLSHPIQGMVYNAKVNAPETNHWVYFVKPLSGDTLSTKTNSDGIFSMDFEFESADSFYVNVFTIDPCYGTILSKSFYPYTSSNYVEFKVCADSVTETNCEARFEYYTGSWNDTVFTSDGTIDSSYSMVYFYDQSIGTINNWLWDFGDGTGSNDKNPIHTFTNSGEYLVTLTISGPDCKNSIQNWIYVGYTEPGCMAWFYYDFGYNYDSTEYFMDSTENNQLTVYFHDYSNGNPTYWKWDFGDGFSSEEQNPVHTYLTPGEYYVYLYISGEGCENWYSQVIWVGNYEPPCQAMFGYDYYNWSDSTTSNGDTATINLNTLYFYDYSFGNPTQWKWDFGDGDFSKEQNPWHSYTQEGSYLVSLEIANESCSSSYSQYVYVGNYVDDSIWEPESCQAYFYPIIETKNKVTFINQSYGSIIDNLWDFGDGTSSNEVNPIHQYTNQGEYLVTLGINTFDNCASKIEMFVWVGNYDTVSNLSALFFPEINGNMVIFHDKSEGIIDNRYWDFGDGTSSTAKDPIHSYEELKTYYVTLGISNRVAVRTFTMEINLADGTFKGYFGNESGTAIAPNQNTSTVNIYPNPVIDRFTLDFNSQLTGTGDIILYNLAGQMIQKEQTLFKNGFNSFDINTDLIEKGVYMLQIKCDNQLIATKKILK